MADALLAFGVYGVRKNRHRPAKRPPDLPPRRRSPAALRQSARPAVEPANFRPRRCGGKPSAVRGKEARPSAFRRATRLPQAAGRRQGRQFPPAQAYMRQKRFGHAAPDRENGTGRPRPSAGKRRGNSSAPLRGRAHPSAGHAPCPLPAEETHPFPRTALLFQGGAPVRRGLNTG